MRKNIKNLYARYFGFPRSHLILALSSMLLLLLTPTYPLGREENQGIDEIDSAQVRMIHETFKIYSILMSHWTDSSKTSVWSIAETILAESEKHSLDPILILAVIHVESRFRHSAVSSEGARGLMQIRPFVAQALAVEAAVQNWEGAKSLADPIVNIKIGVFYLGQLKKRFRDLKLALAAYNFGPTDIRQRLEEGDIIPISYARKVLSIHRAYSKRNPQTQVTLPITGEKAKT